MAALRSIARACAFTKSALIPTAAPARLLPLPARSFSSTPRALGLDEFFDSPQGWLWHKDLADFGRPWTASELRQKSFDDLHKLWYVCLKERNRLASQKDEARRFGKSVPDRNAERDRRTRQTMSLIKLVLWERYLAHKDVRTVFDKASAAQAAADGTAPFADPDVERAMTKALERYEEREARKKLKAMDLEHRIPRKTKLVPKKPKRQPRMGPVLISAKYVVEQAAARGFKDLRPVEEAVLGQVEAGAEAEGAAAAPDSTTVSPAGENTKEAAPSRQ